jgi:hypothetical protein
MTVLAMLCGLILASCSENGVINDVIDGGPTCTPLTCAGASAECGVLSDGCGGTLNCGTCGDGDRCGTGSDANQCVPICTPMTCTELGAGCGMQGDGCGGSIDCGTCSVAGESCGGGGTPNQCGVGTCPPTTCAALMLECGPVSDGCGTLLECGTCTVAGEACGVATPNMCDPICTPTTCAALGAECGTADDGCGGTLTCPTCPAGEMCGIGGANSCGVMGVDAGTIDDGGADSGGSTDSGSGGTDGGSTLIECAPAAGPGGTSFLVSANNFLGFRFEIVGAPVALSSIGLGMGTSGTGTAHATVVRLTGATDLPDELDLTGSDVVARVLVDVVPYVRPPGGGSLIIPVASSPIAGTLEPGWYAAVFGLGSFGATLSPQGQVPVTPVAPGGVGGCSSRPSSTVFSIRQSDRRVFEYPRDGAHLFVGVVP